MKRRYFPGLTALGILLSTGLSESGAAITITGAQLVAAPPKLERRGLNSADTLVFAEKQGFTLTEALDLGKGGTIAAGTVVDVYYVIFQPASTTRLTNIVKFDVPILGYAYKSRKLKKTDFLGSPTTDYGQIQFRGLESGPGTSNRDSVRLTNERHDLSFDIRTRFFGDAVRVIVLHPIPEPTTLLLFGVGVSGLGLLGRSRRPRA